MYLCKFDSDGKRTATVLSGIHFKTDTEKQKYLNDGYIETSDEDYQYYVGNKGTGKNGTGYIRGNDGKPADAPVYVPPEPTTDEKIAALDSQYDSDKAEIMKYYNEALFAGDTDMQADLKSEMAEIDAKYIADRAELEG